MMTVERKEAEKVRIKRDLTQRVRPTRPTAKVLEIAMDLLEERMETAEEERADREWELDYLKGLDPAEIEPDKKKELNDIMKKRE